MAMKSLAIQEITLTNFKNYTESKFSVGPRFNLISGLNGIGKTNLLDAIYYLSVGRSYFTPFDHRIVRKEESFFRLEGYLSRGDKNHKIVFKVKPGSSKELEVDEIPIPRISEHLSFIPVVFSAPRDIDLIYGASLTRRKYFDHLLCQVDQSYMKALVRYNHLLDMRNASLKQGFADLRRVVSTYDDQLAPLAALIHAKRKWAVEILGDRLLDTYRTLSDQKEDIALNYSSDLFEYPYEVLVDMNWETDKHTGRSNSGIHKDDYKLEIKDMSAKGFGSQGQVKSLVFALHLSKYSILAQQSGYKPLLILDDIFDKLDERRLERLMEILSAEEFGQVFISDTSGKRVSEILPAEQLERISM